VVLAATTTGVEPRDDTTESGAAPRARQRVGMGWTAIVGGIALALVVVLILWLVL
jgi:hypothetical protein